MCMKIDIYLKKKLRWLQKQRDVGGTTKSE